jgi:predicted alpha/beta hydrolase family esterase
MRTYDVEILMVPGWTGSGPDHWQTRWQTRLKTSRRVEQDDWDVVDGAKWSARLLEAIAFAVKPVVLVAHSCGVPLVAHAAPRIADKKVVGAFLVAPSSEDTTAKLPGMDPAFAVFPRDPLPFPSLLVASRNDRHCSYDEAGDLALAWGSTLIDAGEVEHLNTASGHGPWPEGAMRFGLFLKQLGTAPAR